MKDISLHILDIAENSVAAGATIIRISIIDDIDTDRMTVEIEDNGKGMPEDLVEKALDPFFTSRTTRKVGLGLSLLAQSARDTGGNISIQSTEGMGTRVSVFFRPSHIDMKPLGNVAETLVVLIAGNPDMDFIFTYDKAGKKYSLDTRYIKESLEEVPINSPDVLSALRNDLEIGLSDISNKVL